MTARLLEGRPVADAIWRDVEQRTATYSATAGRPPTLGLVSGPDESATAYARQIERQFGRRGLRVASLSAGTVDFVGEVRAFSRDSSIDGVLLLTPLPDGVDPEAVALAIDPSKDVDGQHPYNLGRLAQRRSALAPATALGGMRLLEHYAIPLRGARAVVVGRSPVVGMPMALLLIDADATVSVCHSRTQNLAEITRHADLLCVAIGRPRLIGPEHVKPGAVVVDFGTNVMPDGATLGDVQADAVREVAGALTPVPGGTGPITVAVLAQQMLSAAERHLHGR
jgi:methylenetetrahydrofolate dehydrogenase (NADP+) / methenyltetrahydrofolate cyclohydrolase